MQKVYLASDVQFAVVKSGDTYFVKATAEFVVPVPRGYQGGDARNIAMKAWFNVRPVGDSGSVWGTEEMLANAIRAEYSVSRAVKSEKLGPHIDKIMAELTDMVVKMREKIEEQWRPVYAAMLLDSIKQSLEG